jgi:cytochrome b involved in lipid metabolism
MDFAGQDITQAFENIGHSEDALKILMGFAATEAGRQVDAKPNPKGAGTLSEEERQRLLAEHRKSWWWVQTNVVPPVAALAVGLLTYVVVAKLRSRR